MVQPLKENMRIAVNMRLLMRNRLDGIGWFAHESFRRIVEAQPGHEFIFLFDRPYAREFIFASNVRGVVVPPPARHPLLFSMLYNLSLPVALHRIKPDIYVAPDGLLPSSAHIPMLNVIHDLNFEHYPELLPARYRKMYKRIIPGYAHRAQRIATVSEYSRHDISTLYGIDLKHIDVVYNGASEHFVPLDEIQRQVVRDKFSGGKPYFLHVGTLHPRKNIARLIRAYDRFREECGSSQTRLLLAGNRMWWTDELRNVCETARFRDDIVFTGRLSNDELALITASAKALVLVSVFEGFGIPLVEAFRCGVPAIASNVTSLPEVAGDAALLVSPFDEAEIASALVQLDTQAVLRDDLAQKALLRAKEFTWERTASLLWESIVKTLTTS